jgi:hypothetical protein
VPCFDRWASIDCFVRNEEELSVPARDLASTGDVPAAPLRVPGRA